MIAPRSGPRRRSGGRVDKLEDAIMARHDAGASRDEIARELDISMDRVRTITGYLSTKSSDHWASAAVRSSARLAEAIRRHHPEQVAS